MELQKTERLGSLDVLRGFDLFCLVFFQPVFRSLGRAVNTPWMDVMMKPFEHVAWEGFAFWDIIMPLFMFMAGASMPFAFAKYLKNGSKVQLYKRILKRVVLLWIFGMMCQGNLLALDPNRIFFFSNTLQAIAIGYLISAILLMHLNRKGQLAVTAGLLLSYWALLSFVKTGEWGGGNFGPDNNLAEYIDRVVMGRFRDGSTVTETAIDFGKYRYTWLISSLNFGVTVMTGVFAGQIMKGSLPKIRKVQWLGIGGVLMVVAGQLWGLQMPIIKKIWTSSMTLYSSGICFLLMALFYYLVDYKNYGKYLNWLKIYGMNSILAYMLYEIINFGCISNSLLHGTEQFLGNYYGTLIKLANVSIIFFILWLMYRKGKFLKV
ncbi:acyltransferase family protein [Gaoshiqia sp. Z1-71]|uniref:acyltransferase family protein n=1 Tax=Gaoshiqia hydrogeniformans TaxID=3290090 RepID=UPI003BF78C1F